jgi:Cupin-like domain
MQATAEERLSTRFIEQNEEFPQKFNRKPFQFFHNLASHPLFTLPRLLKLASDTRKTRPKDFTYDMGDFQIGQRWDSAGPRVFSLEECIERIENAKAWILLHYAQRDPEYAEMFNQCMREFEEFTGIDVKKVMRVEDALIFITSPNRTTTYHIDRECNFLLQIRGGKTIYIFDQHDREVLPEEEIERFWTVDNNAPVYKPQYQDRSTAFRLEPGNGVHIPVNAPHWLQNDNNVSISFSVNFTHKDSERANIYRANYALRKLGIRPTPPGQSAVTDFMKRSAMAPVVAVRGWQKKLRRRTG